MSDNKQPKIALFLGAGGSQPFGKPTTKKLKEDLIKEYTKLGDDLLKKYAGRGNPEVEELLIRKYLISILSFKEFKDIEHVLQALKEMEDFFSESRYGGKYLHTLIVGKYADKISTDSGIESTFSGYVKTIPEQRRRIEKNIFDNYRWDNNSDDEALGKIYQPLFAEIMKQSNSNDIRIFTTNYDRAIEEYCESEQSNYHCIDGFSPVRGWGRRKWDEGKYVAQLDEEIPVYLYKLHGSLDWKRHKKHGIIATGEEGLSTDSNYIEPMLVYPTLSPKEGEGLEPYKTIREKFKEELLERTDVCIVIGFSFRDEHINLIFSDFIKRVGKTLIVVSPTAEDNIDKNLLEKYELPQAEKTPWSDDENVTIYDVNGTNIIAINDKMTVEGAEKIVMHISNFLSFQK